MGRSALWAQRAPADDCSLGLRASVHLPVPAFTGSFAFCVHGTRCVLALLPPRCPVPRFLVVTCVVDFLLSKRPPRVLSTFSRCSHGVPQSSSVVVLQGRGASCPTRIPPRAPTPPFSALSLRLVEGGPRGGSERSYVCDRARGFSILL